MNDTSTSHHARSETVLTDEAVDQRAKAAAKIDKWGKKSWVRRAPLLPALVFMIIVTQLPFVATLVMSFLNWSAQPDAPGKSFAGLANFKTVFTDRGVPQRGVHLDRDDRHRRVVVGA